MPTCCNENDNDESKAGPSQTYKFRFTDLSMRSRHQIQNRASIETSRSSQDDNDELEVPSQTRQFQFIDVSTRSRGQQTKNRVLARSHVSKLIRRAQRKKHEGTGQVNLNLQRTSWVPSPAQISQRPAMDSTFSALQTYKGKVTPYLYELFMLHMTGVWSVFYVPEPGEPPILAFDWFDLVHSCPALFHAGCYIAATYADLNRSSLFYSVTPEIRMHKIEAIRLINEELRKGKDVPEGVILAAMSLIREASEMIKNQSAIVQLEASPFKQPHFLMQWTRNYLGTRSEEVHVAGCKAIMRAKGGINQLRERAVAFAVSFVNLLEGSFEISEPPDEPFYAIPELLSRMNDPMRNIPLHPIEPHRGSGFVNLLTFGFGLTQEAVSVMMEMLSITVLAENLLQGTLENPDVVALGAMRDRAHLKLLSLPTSAALLDPLKANVIYDCCRFSALLYATGVLFPMPRSTGVPISVIKEIKKCVDQTNLLVLVSEGTRPFFIWVLMLTGVAADGLPEERQWAQDALTVLLTVEGVSRWKDVKKIVELFLWMDSACDGGAMILWDDVAVSMRGG